MATAKTTATAIATATAMVTDDGNSKGGGKGNIERDGVRHKYFGFLNFVPMDANETLQSSCLGVKREGYKV